MTFATVMVSLALSQPNEARLQVAGDLAARFEAGVIGVAAGLVAFFWPQLTAIGLLLIIAGWALGRTADGDRRPLPVRIGLMLVASAVVYVPGLIWLKAATGVAWGSAVGLGLVPFVIGDILKSVVAALLPSRR